MWELCYWKIFNFVFLNWCRTWLISVNVHAFIYINNNKSTDKLAERKRLQEKNIELCVELRKLEARAATLKENLDEHNAEKRQLLADQIKTQRNLQKLLDFISQFKETSISIRSTSISETGSEISKSNED